MVQHRYENDQELGKCMPDNIAKMNLSFAGCGFLGIYHVGVASAFREYAPQICLNQVSGASAGAMAAATLLCGCCLGQCTSDVLRLATKARSRALGPLHPNFQVLKIIRHGLDVVLPANAHSIVSGRLHISLTRLSDGKNVIVSEFDSRDELIDAILCSAFVPFYCGVVPPKYRGVYYIDGGLSDNLPTLNEHTITVSPFSGESDICPDDPSSNFLHISLTNTSIQLTQQNLYRMSRALFPPQVEFREEEDDEARNYGRLAEDRGTAVAAVLGAPGTTVVSVPDHAYDGCDACKTRRQVALLDTLPPAVVQVLQSTVDAANTGILAKVYRYKAAKIFSLMTIPYLLPLDLSYYVVMRCAEYLPKVPTSVWWLANGLLKNARNFVLHKIGGRRQLGHASCRFHFAYTEVDTSGSVPPSPTVTSAANLFVTGASSDPLQKTLLYEEDGSCRELRTPTVTNLDFGFSFDWCGARVAEAGRRFNEEARAGHHSRAAEIAQRATLAVDARRDRVHVVDTQQADTFDHVMDVTSDHEAIMAYYYLDEDRRVHVMEIFDVTEADELRDIIAAGDDERRAVRELAWDGTHDFAPGPPELAARD